MEDLSAMLEGMCLENRSILLDLSAVENLDICNLAPLLILAERKRTRGCKVKFAEFRGRVRRQLQFSKAIDRFRIRDRDKYATLLRDRHTHFVPC